MTLKKNYLGSVYSEGVSGVIDGIEPIVDLTHSANELSIDLDPDTTNFHATVMFACTLDATGTYCDVVVKGSTLRFRAHGVIGTLLAVHVELYGDGTGITAIASAYNGAQDIGDSGYQLSRAHRITSAHVPGSPFTVTLAETSGSSIGINNGLTKTAYAVGG